MQGTYKHLNGPSFGYGNAFKPVDPKAKAIHAEALQWCYQQFGPQSGEEGWTVSWGEAFGHVLFEDRKHAMMFKLTWA